MDRRRVAAWLAAGLFAGAGGASAQNAERTLYVLHCAGCHGMDASGHPERGVPSMRGAIGNFMRLPEGRAFLVQVPGVNNAGLSDAQIANLTNWLLTTYSAATLPAGWRRFEAAELAGLRARRPADFERARADLVAKLRAQGVAVD